MVRKLVLPAMITLEPVGFVVGGLYHVDGSPVLDVEPFVREVKPLAGGVRQPAWATEVVRNSF